MILSVGNCSHAPAKNLGQRATTCCKSSNWGYRSQFEVTSKWKILIRNFCSSMWGIPCPASWCYRLKKLTAPSTVPKFQPVGATSEQSPLKRLVKNGLVFWRFQHTFSPGTPARSVTWARRPLTKECAASNNLTPNTDWYREKSGFTSSEKWKSQGHFDVESISNRLVTVTQHFSIFWSTRTGLERPGLEAMPAASTHGPLNAHRSIAQKAFTTRPRQLKPWLEPELERGASCLPVPTFCCGA